MSGLVPRKSEDNEPKDGSIVHYSGTLQGTNEGDWSPSPKPLESIEWSANSCNGLHTRMLESLPLGEVA